MIKYVVILCCLLSGCCQTYNCNIDSAFSNVTPMVEEANAAFDKAEKEILDKKPNNIIDVNPDPAKCICKGTGVIRQGDDHVTPCPYHAKTTTLKR